MVALMEKSLFLWLYYPPIGVKAAME
jgi:hypothetical protein